MLELLYIDRLLSSVFFFYLIQLFIDDDVPLFIACYFIGAIVVVTMWEYQIIRGRFRTWIVVNMIVTSLVLLPCVLLEVRDISAWTFVTLLLGMCKFEIPVTIHFYKVNSNLNPFTSPSTVSLVADSFAFMIILFMTSYPSVARFLVATATVCWCVLGVLSLLKNAVVIHEDIPCSASIPPYSVSHAAFLRSVRGMVEFNSFSQYSVFTYAVMFIFVRSGIALALYAYWLGLLFCYWAHKLEIGIDKVNKPLALSSSLFLLCAICSSMFFALQLPDVFHEIVHSVAILISVSLVRIPWGVTKSLGKDMFPLVGLYLKTQFVAGPFGIILTWGAFKLLAIAPYVILSLLLVHVTGDYERAYLQVNS